MKFTEHRLETAVIELLEEKGFPHFKGNEIKRDNSEVLIKEDLKNYLKKRYFTEDITENEIASIIREFESLSFLTLYESNKIFMDKVSNGFLLKREDRSKKDLYIELTDSFFSFAYKPENKTFNEFQYAAEEKSGFSTDKNIYKFVNQLEIIGNEKRIPDGILYINGLPLVVFEFKSSVREDADIHDAYIQLTTRYKRDIPQLFKYNAFCVISDGVNNKAGSFFAPYEFFYSWRKISGDEKIEKDGIDSLYIMINGLFHKERLLYLIKNFIFFPDASRKEEKLLCRYPQFYAAGKLFENIKKNKRPFGNGKGGTYFGATGCGKSLIMLFLTRLLMKSIDFSSPTIVLITDRTDLDDQLSRLFTNAKRYIGDDNIISVESRDHLRKLLRGIQSGGVFLTTIHKFTEDTKLLSERNNIICISDEAHRSQINLDQKIRITENGVKKSFGFAKYLHDSLPGATYVGFTGTPVDATMDVFGEVVDSYTMTESVKDEITVRIVYEGRAAKVALDNEKLEEIEKYYEQCELDGASEYQVEESKKANARMNVILGDPNRINSIAKDFVDHYEKRVNEGSTIRGKALFVSSSRQTAYDFFKAVIKLRPEWNEVRNSAPEIDIEEKELKKIKPSEKIKMIMTRGKDDPEELYNLIGTKDYRKELDIEFKKEKSNFKIAVVVDMWLTGFDVPFLDTIYIDKPIQKHNLIQTISRVNRKFEEKEKGLVVDYIGIKKQMNKALAQYSSTDKTNFEDIEQSVIVVKDHLDLLDKLFHKFDKSPYFKASSTKQLECLNMAAEFAQITREMEKRFMYLVKRLKAAYDICCGSEKIDESERDNIHFYLAVRSIIFKLTKGNAPDSAQMNAKVREMIKEALKSDGVEEIFKLGDEKNSETDIFDENYLEKINKIKLPNTRIKLLQQLLAKAIDDFKKTNKIKGVDFSKKFKTLVERYNERKEQDILVSNVLEDFTDEIIDLFHALKKEKESFEELGIDFEEKAFYDILKELALKYDFSYPEDKLLSLSLEVKKIVDDKAKYTDWSRREDIKAELKADLIIVLAEHNYPPVDRDEVYKEIFEQAENFKKYQRI